MSACATSSGSRMLAGARGDFRRGDMARQPIGAQDQPITLSQRPAVEIGFGIVHLTQRAVQDVAHGVDGGLFRRDMAGRQQRLDKTVIVGDLVDPTFMSIDQVGAAVAHMRHDHAVIRAPKPA